MLKKKIIITSFSVLILFGGCDLIWGGEGIHQVSEESEIITTDIEDRISYTCIDNDGDSFGENCLAGEDCNDSDVEVNPGSLELCENNLDNNCDGFLDFIDEDEDGFNFCFNDCDDKNANKGIGIDCNYDGETCGDFYLCFSTCPVTLPENCKDGIDNDCDGLIDIDDPNCDKSICPDNDDDGYSPRGDICGPIDCEDENDQIYPGQEEICDDGLDNNCDGEIDSIDYDGDGYDVCDLENPDCNDTDYTINPGAPEICDDGLDNNCDTFIDYGDVDQDGWDICGGDCDDTNPNVNPAQTEICGNDHDDDCDGYPDFIEDPAHPGLSLCCGDGQTDPPFEQCDDGNTVMHDDCNNFCNDNRLAGSNQTWGSPCYCQPGSGCSQEDYTAGTIIGCDNLGSIPNGAEKACYYSIYVNQMGVEKSAWFANGYCTAMALICEDSPLLCGAVPAPGNFNNFTSCPAGTVLTTVVATPAGMTVMIKMLIKALALIAITMVKLVEIFIYAFQLAVRVF